MVVHGSRNFLRFSLSFRVKAADNSLKLRELANHIGDEVTLGEFRGAVGVGDASFVNASSKPLLRQPSRESAHSLYFFAVASELHLKGYLRKFWQIVGESTFLIGFPKKSRVGKARAQNTLMPGAN